MTLLPAGRRLRWSWAGFFAGLILLAILMRGSGATLAGLESILSTTPLSVWVASAALNIGIVVVAAIKWRMVLSETNSGNSLPLGAAISATATGALLGQAISIQVSLPIVRAWTARRFGIGAGPAAGTSLFEQSLELLTLAIAALASVILVVFGGKLWWAAAVFVSLLVAATLVLPPVLRAVAAALRMLSLPSTLGRLTGLLADSLDLAARQRPFVLRRLMALSLIRYSLITCLHVLLLVAFLPGLDPVPLIAAFPLILLVMSLPFLPAGLGVTEVTWTGALLVQGVDPATAAEAALALRVIATGGFLIVYPALWLAGYGASAQSE